MSCRPGMPLTITATCMRCACLAAGLLLPSTASAWTSPLNLTRGAGDAGSGVMAVDGAGNMHLLVGRSGQQIWNLRVVNQVQTTWSVLVDSGGVNPALAVDSLGRAHAIYSRGYEIQYQQFDNGIWSAPMMISTGGGGVGRCHLCVDTTDNVHVVWGADGQVWYRRRPVSGTWDSATQITGASDLEFYFSPRVAVVNNAPLVLYGKHNGGNWNAWVATRESGAWVNTLLDGNAGCSNGDLCVSGDGVITAGWDQGYDVYTRRRVGGVWEPRFPLRVSGVDSSGPRFSAGLGSTVDAIWLESADLTGSRWNGSSWSAPGSITGGLGGVGHTIAQDGSGRQYVSWSKNWDMWVGTSTPAADPAPPPVTTASILTGQSRVTLSWANPQAYDLAKVGIVWRSDRAPTSPTDGTLVLERAAIWGADSFTHTGISNGILHYYGVYVVDAAGQASSCVQLSGRPTLKQDFDGDGDVDQSDFGQLQRCLTGLAGSVTASCRESDLNSDSLVTTADLDGFLACIGGATIRPPDTCSPF